MIILQCLDCGEDYIPFKDHKCDPVRRAANLARHHTSETQEQLIRRVIKEELKAAFPEAYYRR